MGGKKKNFRSLFSLGSLCVSRGISLGSLLIIQSIQFVDILLFIGVSCDHLYCCGSVTMPLLSFFIFSFLILSTWIFFFFFLVQLKVCQFCLLFFKKRLVSLIFPTALPVSISFLPHTQLCSCAQSCPTLGDPTDCSLPGSSVYEFSQQEYWSGVPLPSP